MPSGKKIATLCATAGLLATLPARAEELPPTTLPFHNVVTGEPLDLASSADTGRSTPAVKEFMQTGHDPYLTIPPNCYEQFESIFLTACSGCHGHLGEGKIGPGLNDNYWTYPDNVTDVGLFSTIYGGAQAQMGPHSDLELDQILQVMAWVRHLYTGPVKDAPWLDATQKAAFKPYAPGEPKPPASGDGSCIARPYE